MLICRCKSGEAGRESFLCRSISILVQQNRTSANRSKRSSGWPAGSTLKVGAEVSAVEARLCSSSDTCSVVMKALDRVERDALRDIFIAAEEPYRCCAPAARAQGRLRRRRAKEGMGHRLCPVVRNVLVAATVRRRHTEEERLA